jgi:hypothetical protein
MLGWLLTQPIKDAVPEGSAGGLMPMAGAPMEYCNYDPS